MWIQIYNNTLERKKRKEKKTMTINQCKSSDNRDVNRDDGRWEETKKQYSRVEGNVAIYNTTLHNTPA